MTHKSLPLIRIVLLVALVFSLTGFVSQAKEPQLATPLTVAVDKAIDNAIAENRYPFHEGRIQDRRRLADNAVEGRNA